MKMGLCAIAVLLSWASIAYAADPNPLQDFCVALPDNKSDVFVNGKFCKDPNLVVAEDFLFQGLNIPGNTSNQLGSAVTAVNVNQLPGLNTLGVSLARLDFAPYGLNPPTPTLRNKLFTKYLKAGDVFVFPQGLIHFQINVGKTNAVAFAGFGSQNPGVITIANAVFGSDPKINPDVLAKAFQVEKNIIDYLQAQFWPNN
ncbi:hypothetical protein SASPL_125080 [Salvia splendens]|uniref:Germin-like protein n=1 Tax=Salvia splendens TaxID=180675 RepID=A0A8X8XGH7_SALSN|nr:hypothetical protein SASPL_125080 [Salvia splendens]